MGLLTLLGWLAYSGRISWGWVVALAAACAALLGWRRRDGVQAGDTLQRPPGPPPVPPSARLTVDQVVDHLDQVSDAEIGQIMDAADSDDRLDRLAALNDAGRRHGGDP